MKDLDNPMHDCKWIRALDLESIYKKAAQEGETRDQKMEIKKHQDALKATSTHFCDNALFRVDFGYNPLGVTLATPTDMMHLFESGTIPRVLRSLVQSMSNSMQGQVDDLIEELFLTHRSSCSSEFLRMKFRNGATNLTMLSSHHWPGMAFAFLLVILSDKGKEITKDCFQKGDAPEPNFDWTTAPGMDYNNVYQPPVLAKVNLQSDDESNDSSHSSFSTSDDDDLTDAEVDDKGVAILPPQEFSSDEIIPSPKKKDEKKPVKMTCSGRQMVSLLEELLSFHSWYKYGEAPFGPNYENGNADDLLLLLRQMMARTIAFCPREDGNGWKLQKLHEQLHLVIALVFFQHAQNFDAGSGERLLKDFFKKLAQTCQQRGQDTFIHQVSCRLQTLMTLRKARNASRGYSILIERRRKEELPAVVLDHRLNGGHLYSIVHDLHTKGCTFEMHSSNKGTQVHLAILSWLGKNWKKVVSSNNSCLTLCCFTEYVHKNGTKFRSHPNYHDEGPWYDWASVSFGENGATENVPCRLLLFYSQPSPDNDLSDSDSSECTNDECGIRALVQTCSYRQALGMPKECKEKLYDTNLLSRHALAATRVVSSISSPAHNLPRIDSVPVESIQDNLIVVEETPGLCESWHGTRYVWLAKNRKLEWPSMFHIGA
jgi:hypothetical protein